MSEKKTLQEWIAFIDDTDAPPALNEEFNKIFRTKGVQYPMKLFSTYILRKEIARGNIAAIRLEAMMKGALKVESELSLQKQSQPIVINLEDSPAAREVKEIWAGNIDDIDS